jgi:hypothetical protein
MAEKGTFTNKGERTYSIFYLTIPSHECINIPTRMKVISRFSSGYHINQAHPEGKPIYIGLRQKIVKVELLDGLHTTYCFDEPKLHQGVFGNVLTKQCNVVETFPGNHDNPSEFYETLKYAYLYAKSVTLLPTHEPRTNAVMLRNRRIGISQSGIEQAKKKFGTYAYYQYFCNKGYDVIKQWDNVYSDWLCIPRSKRISTVKPSGTVSLLAGATPGIHYSHSEFYFRTVRVSSNSSLLNPLREAGYKIEPCNTDKDNTSVVYFPICEKNFTKSKSEVTIWEQMENIAKIQQYWADNSVSCTVTFSKEEAKEIKNVLEIYQDRIKVVSFLPLDDHGYQQAPYITISKQRYEEEIKSIKPLCFTDGITQEDRKEEKFCSNESCSI